VVVAGALTIWEQIDIYQIGVYQGLNYAFIMSEKVKNLIKDNCLSDNYKVKSIKLISKNQTLNYYYFKPEIPLEQLKAFNNVLIYDKRINKRSDFQIKSETELEKRNELFKTGNFIHIKKYQKYTDITSAFLYPGLYFSESLVKILSLALVSGVEFKVREELQFRFDE